MSSHIQFINPDGLHHNPAFSQLVTVKGPVKTVYIGGQNAVNKNGELQGKGDIEAQAKQVLHNIQTALKAAGASFGHIVKWNVYILQGQAIEKALKVFQEPMSQMKNPPIITGIFVAALAHPDYLLEMDAMAVVPEEQNKATTKVDPLSFP